MAGPGGGPPRKSHTKSRKGCKTCKKRHIRCDELFPQCRNCTKHNCRCDYMDLPSTPEDAPGSSGPDLLLTPLIEREIDAWRTTGHAPFPELQLTPPTYWQSFTSSDLRLLHHVAGLTTNLHQRGYSSFTVWAPRMPGFLAISLHHSFVMSAILAFSAAHLAWLTNNAETNGLAYHHHGVAIKGLHEAISAFSPRNSEGILAASMILSWQASEWRSWASLQQGVSTVLNAMQPWAHESELATYLTSQRIAWKSRRPVISSPPGTQSRLSTEDISHLDHAIVVLQNLQQRFALNTGLSGQIAQLYEFTLQLRNDLPLQVPEKAFKRLQTLRSWLFWLPPMTFQSNDADLAAMVVLLHFFAISMTLEPLFPEIGAGYIGSMCVSPIEEMHNLMTRRQSEQLEDPSLHMALRLMEFPYQVVSRYRSRLEYLSRNTEVYRSAPHSPYGIPDLQSAYAFEAPPPIPYHHSPVGSPANFSVPAAPSSPYLDPRAATSTSRQNSQYLGQPSPMLHSYPRTPFGPEGDLSFGDAPFGYNETYQAYGGMGGDPNITVSTPPSQTSFKGKEPQNRRR